VTTLHSAVCTTFRSAVCTTLRSTLRTNKVEIDITVMLGVDAPGGEQTKGIVGVAAISDL